MGTSECDNGVWLMENDKRELLGFDVQYFAAKISLEVLNRNGKLDNVRTK